MKICFLPTRGSILESFSASRVFNSILDLFAFHRDRGIADIKDFSISYYCFDTRFQCECYALTTTTFEDQKYERPQIVGFVYFGLAKACLKKRLYDYLEVKE